MTENVLDVLMYLFETYTDADAEPEPDRNALRDELERAGFHDGEIDKALEWLDGLAARDEDPVWQAPTERAIRVFSHEEFVRLDAACRGYIMYLEQIGILTPAQRELVIDRLMALGEHETDVEQIKWVVLMVLFSQPGQENAYARMEDLVFEDQISAAH
jgi:Smg protein